MAIPATQHTSKSGEIMIRLEQLSSHLNRHVAKLKKKYHDISNGIVQAIIEEEMKTRREEIGARVGSPNRHDESRVA
jgi:hypothetical protein